MKKTLFLMFLTTISSLTLAEVPNIFSPGQIASSTKMNENFDNLTKRLDIITNQLNSLLQTQNKTPIYLAGSGGLVIAGYSDNTHKVLIHNLDQSSVSVSSFDNVGKNKLSAVGIGYMFDLNDLSSKYYGSLDFEYASDYVVTAAGKVYDLSNYETLSVSNLKNADRIQKSIDESIYVAYSHEKNALYSSITKGISWVDLSLNQGLEILDVCWLKNKFIITVETSGSTRNLYFYQLYPSNTVIELKTYNDIYSAKTNCGDDYLYVINQNHTIYYDANTESFKDLGSGIFSATKFLSRDIVTMIDGLYELLSNGTKILLKAIDCFACILKVFSGDKYVLLNTGSNIQYSKDLNSWISIDFPLILDFYAVFYVF